jgi:hypothetical protein
LVEIENLAGRTLSGRSTLKKGPAGDLWEEIEKNGSKKR